MRLHEERNDEHKEDFKLTPLANACRYARCSFNWRMKFDVELGHNTQAMKFPYLHLQAWDKDLLKFSDCIAESFIDLGNNFKRAYKKNQTIEVYKKRNLKRELERKLSTPSARETCKCVWLRSLGTPSPAWRKCLQKKTLAMKGLSIYSP